MAGGSMVQRDPAPQDAAREDPDWKYREGEGRMEMADRRLGLIKEHKTRIAAEALRM